jgi:tripartite-type tricarboxylate transporter receptor subunit TctC
MAPGGLPADGVEVLGEAVANAVQSEPFTTLMQSSGFGIRYMDTGEFTAFVASEDATIGELMQAVGLAE